MPLALLSECFFKKQVLEGEMDLKSFCPQSVSMCLAGALWVVVVGTIPLCSLVRREGPERSPTHKRSDHFSIHTIIHCSGVWWAKRYYLQCNADQLSGSCSEELA